VEVQLTHPPELGIRIQRLAFAPVSTPVEDDLVGALIADLSATGEVEILDRANVERILKEQKFSNSGLVDEKSAVELGRLLGSPVLAIVNDVGMCHFLQGDCETALPFLKAAQDTDVDSGIYRDAVNECALGAQLQAGMRKASQGAPAVPALEAAPAAAAVQPASSDGKPSIEERLQKLDGLLKKGLITEEDYRKRKDEILKEI
jgi:hypothetical protein